MIPAMSIWDETCYPVELVDTNPLTNQQKTYQTQKFEIKESKKQ